ncbi:helix-turn-helix domain-containing protein [Acinetobacter sp. ANC 4862]|uniref:helix-turn-helix domain-containing protein n=1 Tax=Acinetobacter sp. ANC 4862 TaxID=2529849 RepID=UPI001040304F|nr:helix-turn-helix domain-containing protein [Acinetobacter sp. ANC 4862]TCH60693.1 hypothetical protein E0409_16005 [Acinetobacter sp. ANC 4862]
MNDIPASKATKKGFPKKKSLPAGVHHHAYRFPIFPTEEQKVLLAKTFGSTRFMWNALLADSKAEYEQTSKHRINTPAKYKTEFPWLGEPDSLALTNVQLNLKKAYSAFFDKENPAGPPSFKKKTHRQSYTTNNQVNEKAPNGSISLVGDEKQRSLKLPKLGWVSIRVHRELGGVITLIHVTDALPGQSPYPDNHKFELIKI